MKTEERHKLQQNELADRIGLALEGLAPYSKAIFGAIGAVVLVAIAWSWYASAQQGRADAAWAAYFAATEFRDLSSGGQTLKSSKLKEFVDNSAYAGTPANVWGRLALAEEQLDNGIDELFRDRVEGEENLGQAKTNFERVRKDAPTLGGPNAQVLGERATLGLGKTLESLGDVDKAIEAYKELEKKWPNSSYHPLARARVAELERPQATEFYDWFRQQEPIRRTSPAGPGTPGERPAFDFDLLKQPGLLEPGAKTVPEADESFFQKPPKDDAAPKGDAPKGEAPKGDAPKGDAPQGEAKK